MDRANEERWQARAVDKSSAEASGQQAEPEDPYAARRADALVALNPPGWESKGTGGRHVELGSALTLGRPVILLGPRTNTFHHHSDVQMVDTATGVLTALTSLWALQVAERR